MSDPDRTPDDTAPDSSAPDDTAPDNSATDRTDVLSAVGTEATEPEARTRRSLRRPRRRGLAIGIAAVMTLGVAGAAVATAHKSVEIDVDGETVSVGTFAGDVGALLDEQGVTVGEHDLVVPGPGETLTDGTDVVIRTAEPIEVTVDGETTTVWTVEDTAAAALATLQASGRDAEMSVSRTSSRPALDLPLVADGAVAFAVDGEQRSVDIAGVADLATALLAAEISVDADDRVAVAAGDGGVPLVTVTRIATEPGTRTEPIAYETVERPTDDLYEGEDRVVSEGAEGERTYTFVNRLVDGEVTSSRLAGVEVTLEPQDRVVEYGTAQRPAPPAPAPSGGGGGGGGGGGTVSGDVWAALAQCESGGNPTTNTGNGYYGLYQFSLPTWQSVGGSGLPSEASAAEQTERAQILQARSGWGQWPACSAKLGLR